MRKLIRGALVAAVATATLLPATAAVADVTRTAYFTLADVPEKVNASLELGDNTVAQSFGYDDDANMLYTFQVSNRRAGDPDNEDPGVKGHLTVTRIDNAATSRKSVMYLRNFGHGVSFGVEPVKRDDRDGLKGAWLWAEVGPVTEGGDRKARGTRIARFVFRAGRTLTYRPATDDFTASDLKDSDPVVRTWTLVPDSTENTVSLDWPNRRLALRYKTAGAFRYALFDVNRLMEGGQPAAIADIRTPAQVTGTFQGYTLYGSWLYFITGARREGAKLVAYDLSSDRSLTTYFDPPYADYEPEGIAVRHLPTGGKRLRFGISIGEIGHRRLATWEKAEMAGP